MAYDDPRPSSPPVGTTSLAVAKDNLITFDKLTNENGTVTNRKGEELKTPALVQAESEQAVDDLIEAGELAIATAIASAGYQIVGDFADVVKVEITSDNQVYTSKSIVGYESALWRTNQALPYTPTGSDPTQAPEKDKWLAVAVGEIKAVARSLNVPDDAVIYGLSGQVVTEEAKYLYNPDEQTTYGLPAGVGAGEVIVSVVGDQLETDISSPSKYTIINANFYINSVESIAELRTKEPSFDKQFIEVAGYYETSKSGGGQFLYDSGDTSTVDDGGLTIVTSDGARWKRVTPHDNVYNVNMFGAKTSLADNAPNFTTAIENIPSGASLTFIGWYNIQTPIIIPNNKKIKIIGSGTYKASSVLLCSNWQGGIDDFVLGNIGDSESYGGLVLRDFQVMGNGNVCHGVHFKFHGGMEWHNILIEGFKGSGLDFDKVQDSTFRKVDVQNCGRTSGDYSSATDCADIAKITAFPINIHSTVTGDHCNYLRFYDYQWEANRVGVTCAIGSGSIQNYFINGHAEHRSNVFVGESVETTMFYDFGSDFIIQGCGQSQITNLVRVAGNGYGSFHISDVQRGGALVHAGSGVIYDMFVTNSSIGSVVWNAVAGEKKFSNSEINGDVTISYPGGEDSTFSNTHIAGNVTVSNVGAPQSRTIFSDCEIDGDFTANTSAIKVDCLYCHINGDAIFNSPHGRTIRPVVDGTVTHSAYNTHTFIPNKREQLAGGPPIYGSWSAGDITWNSTPAPSGYIGWVFCNPGGWKGFGSIAP